MRVVVVGGSGNAGTALLRLLRTDPTVTSLAAVARRTPHSPPPAPYDTAVWTSADIGSPGPDEPVVAQLRDAFSGADAVVHLAWAIQPSHDRSQLRRTNVDGTRRVLAAVAQTGVPQIVVASSVGAYSPVTDDEPRDESWATGGVRSSSYSVDKVAVERLLDETEERYPSLVVTRARPALVFQRAAGREITRYFLGAWVPTSVLDGRLPVLPWPRDLRLQVVHADDLARAYREMVVRRIGGAFNIAAPGVLRAQDVADLVSGGAWRAVSRGPVRAAVTAAWHLRMARVGPGWFDMAAGAPLLDGAHAARSLDFVAVRSGRQALADLLGGMVDGAGTASPPLRPR